MKIKITTDRLPHKYPKGSVFAINEGTKALNALLNQGEAVILEEKKEEPKKEVKVEKKAEKKTVKKSK